MGNWIVPSVLVVIVALNSFLANSFSLEQPYWLSIDCGSTSEYQDEINTDLTWQTDDNFTKSGENKFLISVNTSFLHMKTLRSFPIGKKNCYNLPLKAQSKYLVRAGFLYANYDNLKKPPRFVLRIVGYGNGTVAISDQSIYKPVYHEFFIVTKTNIKFVDVCLIRIEEEEEDDNVPFISSLEATRVGSWTYQFLTNRTSFYLESRINYGANQSVPARLNYKAEQFNRIWEPREVPPYRSVSDKGSFTYAPWPDNNPPFQVLYHAIVARNVSESISLAVEFRRNSLQQAYFVFYMAVIPDIINSSKLLGANETMTVVSIFIDGQEKNTTFVPYWYSMQEAAVVSVFPVVVSGGTANVTISAAQSSTLPPIINAMEVFSVVVDINEALGFRSTLGFSIILLGLALLISSRVVLA